MSRRSNKKKKVTLERASLSYPPGGSLMYVPPGALQTLQGQAFYGTKANIPVGQTALFSPGQPLAPQPGTNPDGLPVTFRFPVAYNSFPVQRDYDGAYDIPSFEQLKRLALMDYGITLCERFWLDMVPKMILNISLSPEAIEGGAVEKDYVKEKNFFKDFYAKPDGTDHLHSWIRKALINQSRYDGLFIYKNKTRGGKLLGLEIIDPAQMKPLLDVWGRIPRPPAYAYQQYPWGVPGFMYSMDQMLYYRETPADDSPFGFSRVERVVFITNLALRKQKMDMAHFSEGNIPAGILTPPEGSNWTPDQLDSYEQAWNALIAGNLQQLARVKVTQPGFEYTPFVQPSFDSVIDRYWLNIRTASYGITPADLGFTETVNRSTGETQQDVTFDRTIGPLAIIYAGILTDSMRTDFPPERKGNMFVAKFGGYEQKKDESDKAKALTMYTSAGILGLSNAAKLADLPEDPNAAHIGRMLITPNGPIFLDDVADPSMRAAYMKAQMAKLQSDNDTEMQHAKNNAQQSSSKSSNKNEVSTSKGSSSAKDDDQSDRSDAKSNKPVKRMSDLLEEAKYESQEWLRADYRRWREIALKDIKQNKPIRRFISEFIPDDIHQQLSEALEQCATADEVRETFKAAQEGTMLPFFRARCDWRAPSSIQVNLETTLARAIKAFVLKTTIVNGVAIVPGEQARGILLDVLQDVFASAVHEGRRIATGTEDRSLISAAKNAAGRAVQLISEIVSHIREKVQSILDGLSGSKKAKDGDIDHDLKEWAEGYADRLAGDKVHWIVEEEVLDGMKHDGVTMVVCITEGDNRVCDSCKANVDQGPIPLGTPFLSGQWHAPFHFLCRCNVGPA